MDFQKVVDKLEGQYAEAVSHRDMESAMKIMEQMQLVLGYANMKNSFVKVDDDD